VTTHEIIQRIIEREGGYVDNALDKGGPTRFGITMSTLAKWRDHLVTPSDVKLLTPEEAAAIYLSLYVTHPGFDQINDDKLRSLVVDCAVLHGPATVTKWLQAIVETAVDGVLGTNTAAAVNSENATSIYLLLCAKRVRFFGEIITKDHTQAVFAHGWLNRAAEFIEEIA
jgi:lysozyme family protein